MPRVLVVFLWVTLGLWTGLASQQLHPPPPNGPRPNAVPNPAARTKSEAGPLFPESTHIAPPTPDPILADHDLNVGKFYYNHGDYVGALARFEDAISNNPALAEAYCRAGDTLWKMHRVQPARSEWGRCALLARSGKWGEHARKQLKKHTGSARNTLGRPTSGGPGAQPLEHNQHRCSLADLNRMRLFTTKSRTPVPAAGHSNADCALINAARAAGE